MFILANRQAQAGVEKAIAVIKDGGSALDAVEEALKAAESDPTSRFSGYGGAPDMTGVLTCDSAIMDGDTRETGAVGAVSGYLHVISLARKVMKELPHVMLVGHGAERFAAELGMKQQDMLSPEAKIGFETWLRNRVSKDHQEVWPNLRMLDYVWPSGKPSEEKDTSVIIAQDKTGKIATGTTTSGWSYKYPGRLGDSSLIGAGLYADSTAGACVCTHTGEVIIRGVTAHTVVMGMKLGKSVEDAARYAVEDIQRLRGGYLGPVVIHSADKQGNIQVYCCAPDVDYNDNLFPEAPAYYYWKKGMKGADLREAIKIEAAS